jgi:hypothetical protein
MLEYRELLKVNILGKSYKIDELSIDELYQFAKGICRCVELSGSNVRLDISESDLEEGLKRYLAKFLLHSV